MNKKLLVKVGFAVLSLCLVTGVFYGAKYIVQAIHGGVYVDETPEEFKEGELTVTRNDKGKSVVVAPEDIMKKFNLPDIPACDGKTDVLLEIVPEKKQQTMAWLTSDCMGISEEELTRRISATKQQPIDAENGNMLQNYCQVLFQKGGQYVKTVWDPSFDLYEKDSEGNYVHQEIFDKVSEYNSDESISAAERKIKVDNYIKSKCYTNKFAIFGTEQRYKVRYDKATRYEDIDFSDPAFAGIPEAAKKDKYNWKYTDVPVYTNSKGENLTSLETKSSQISKLDNTNGKKYLYVVYLGKDESKLNTIPDAKWFAMNNSQMIVCTNTGEKYNGILVLVESESLPAIATGGRMADAYKNANQPGEFDYSKIYNFRWGEKEGDYYIITQEDINKGLTFSADLGIDLDNIEFPNAPASPTPSPTPNYNATPSPTPANGETPEPTPAATPAPAPAGYEKMWVYTCVKNNDILKWAMVNPFADSDHKEIKKEKEFRDEMNRKFVVVVATPEQVNIMNQYDTEETVDYIERANMIYLGGIKSNSDGQTGEVASFCDKFIVSYEEQLDDKGNVTSTSAQNYQPGNVKYLSFNDAGSKNDLEWNLCMKILKKAGTYMNVPIHVNSKLMNDLCSGDVRSYICPDGNKYGEGQMNGAYLCNVGKTVMILSQFNLLARRNELPEDLTNDEKKTYISYMKNLTDIYKSDGLYKGNRTFMEDIFPNIKKIKLKDAQGTCKYTGYYDRPKKEDDKETFLWNFYTFYPIEANANVGGTAGKDWSLDLREKWGYLETFSFKRDDPDGDIYKNDPILSIDKSAVKSTETHKSNRDLFWGTDANRSTSGKHYQNVVGDPENQGIFVNDTRFSTIFSALREIMLTGSHPTAREMKVKVKKPGFEYKGNYAWFLNLYEDASENATIESDETVTVKFTVENPADNKNDGFFWVQEVNLEDGHDKKTNQYFADSLSNSNAYLQDDDCITVEVMNNKGEYLEEEKVTDMERDVKGYKVPAGETVTCKFVYKLTDYLGTTSGLDGKKYPYVLFSTHVVAYDIEQDESHTQKGDDVGYLVKKTPKKDSNYYRIRVDKNGKIEGLMFEGSDKAVWDYSSEKPLVGSCVFNEKDGIGSVDIFEDLDKIDENDYVVVDSSWVMNEIREKTDPEVTYTTLDFLKRHLFNLE